MILISNNKLKKKKKVTNRVPSIEKSRYVCIFFSKTLKRSFAKNTKKNPKVLKVPYRIFFFFFEGTFLMFLYYRDCYYDPLAVGSTVKKTRKLCVYKF